MPVFASTLEELPMVLKYLDRRYGTHDIEDANKTNGEYALRFILKHLALHKESTCLEIAKAEHDRTPQSQKKQRKLKSITDDVRKFIKYNLIATQLVYKGEPKKIANKHIETFSLSPIGILYVIHLFANVRSTDDMFFEIIVTSDIDEKFIRKLGNEYSQRFPKIFGRYKLFKKILGKDFEKYIIESFIEILSGWSKGVGIPNERFLLTDYILTHFLFTSKIRKVHDLIAEQISLLFYVHFEEGLVNALRNEIEEDPKFRKKDVTYKHRESLNQAREKWIQIMDEDRELKKWYATFLKNATIAKKREYGVVSTYSKDVFSHWNFPSNQYP